MKELWLLLSTGWYPGKGKDEEMPEDAPEIGNKTFPWQSGQALAWIARELVDSLCLEVSRGIWMWHLGMCFRGGCGGCWVMVGSGGFEGLFQPVIRIFVPHF